MVWNLFVCATFLLSWASSWAPDSSFCWDAKMESHSCSLTIPSRSLAYSVFQKSSQALYFLLHSHSPSLFVWSPTQKTCASSHLFCCKSWQPPMEIWNHNLMNSHVYPRIICLCIHSEQGFVIVLQFHQFERCSQLILSQLQKHLMVLIVLQTVWSLKVYFPSFKRRWPQTVIHFENTNQGKVWARVFQQLWFAMYLLCCILKYPLKKKNSVRIQLHSRD